MSDPFTLQLHVTDACPLQCRHCYREGRKGEMPLSDIERVVDDFRDFCRSRRIGGRVTFAGGEPMLRIGDLLPLIRRTRDCGLQAHLLTSGWGLSQKTASELYAAGCTRVQVSVDGDAEAHDRIRGAGAYETALSALAAARGARLPATISFTIGAWNRDRLESVIRLARGGQSKLFVSRFVPCGGGKELRGELLSRGQWRTVMRRCRELGRSHPPGVPLRDPLYAPLRSARNRPHPLAIGGCAVGHAGLAVDSDGTAYPCRRLPVPLGNVRDVTFESVWRSPILESLRDRDRLKGQCGACRHRWACGGCRAIAHSVTGDLFAPDPQCCWS